VIGWPALDWAILAVSFFNTVLVLWLGFTVLLNAERRSWSIVLPGGGLLLAAGFLFAHAAIFAQGLTSVGASMTFWWRVGWVLVVALPFTWYAIILWYGGYWDGPRGPLSRRHRPWLVISMLLALGLIGLLLFANPFPTYTQVALLEMADTPTILGVPLLGLDYPLYIMLCIALSLDVLARPAPPGHALGDEARRRARPWLVATSLGLLLVSGLVAWVLVWVMANARQRVTTGAYLEMARAVAGFDLAIDSLIGASILLLGQAIVSYEIFTGRALPRGGLRRQWRSIIVLAAAYAAVVAGILTLQAPPVYGLLLATLLVVLAYALLNRQAYRERQRAMAHLRPFVSSQHLYERLAQAGQVDVADSFQALCSDVLGAQTAYLAALGPLASLVEAGLSYPEGKPLPGAVLSALAAGLTAPGEICLPLEPERAGGALWAAPLWSERGLIGALLLGPRRDGGLYTQEEIEVARAAAERLLDVLASTEMARRLMALQRRGLAESEVADRRTRRVLHDDILPQLHTAILELSASMGASEVVTALAELHGRVADLLRAMPAPPAPALAELGLAGALRQALEAERGRSFDDVVWEADPQAECAAQELPARTAEVLYYAAREAMRNAARYGRGEDTSRPLRLHLALTWQEGLQILIEDNGVGLGAPGAAAGGSGQGLALHSTMMSVIGGSLAVASLPGVYTRVTLSLPAEK